jgi:hypothetical protein
MGVLLGEWREVSRPAARRMNFGVLTLLIAIVICALATKVGL